jgi:hypothetical protein
MFVNLRLETHNGYAYGFILFLRVITTIWKRFIRLRKPKKVLGGKMEDSSRSLASGIFSRGDSKTQTQHLTKSTPPDEFNFQLNVALLVDFLQGGIKRPLLNVCPSSRGASRTTLPELSLTSSKPKIFRRVPTLTRLCPTTKYCFAHR